MDSGKRVRSKLVASKLGLWHREIVLSDVVDGGWLFAASENSFLSIRTLRKPEIDKERAQTFFFYVSTVNLFRMSELPTSAVGSDNSPVL